MALLQYPLRVGVERATAVAGVRFSSASLAVVRDAIAANLDAFGGTGWAARIAEDVPAPFAGLVRQLSVTPIPVRDEEGVAGWAAAVTASLLDRELLRRKADALGRLQRTDPTDREATTGIQRELVQIDQQRAQLRAE